MFLVESLKALYEHDENERIMDKLIEALIGPPGNGNWDRNVLSELVTALVGEWPNTGGLNIIERIWV